MKLVLVALVVSVNAIAQTPEPAPAPAGVPGNFICTAAGKAPYLTTYRECLGAFRRHFEATAGCAADPHVLIANVGPPQWGPEAQAVLTAHFLYLYNKKACGLMTASAEEDAIRASAVEGPIANAVKEGALGLVAENQVLGTAFTQLECVGHSEPVQGTSPPACRCNPKMTARGMTGAHWSSNWNSCLPDYVIEEPDLNPPSAR